MSSEYIPRLRSELLRAGAAQQRRRRRARLQPALRPLATAAAVALLALVVISGLARMPGGDDAAEADRVLTTYRVEGARPEAAAQAIRMRMADAGFGAAGVSVTPDGHLRISAPASAQAETALLAAPGRLALYDWEPSLLGPGGAPDRESAGGDPHAAGVTRDEAQARAATRPDGRAVRDPATGLWFALAGEPALTNAHVAGARATGGRSAREPAVRIDFTDRGQDAFSALTRDVARRASARAGDGAGGLEAYQHFAIVLDDRVLAVPYVDHVGARNGLDGSRGALIQGGLTDRAARSIAAVLRIGPLPGTLSRADRTTTR